MAPISPGMASRPPRKAKTPTQSTNLHRFESFTKRIARLKIDPVHTVERRAPSNDETDLSQSYFRTALDEWAELNLSRTFTSFLNQANPLCENLPQLLHHADKVFDLLVQHIEKKDALALEPLLSLVAHLAHDLGQRFEQYFARTVSLVAEVAASQDGADVIEWCFTCLAWMFKYLSRLLVQDLRPLLDIMIPYLAAKKEYIVRFCAESLAFLLRKAATMYQKKKAPLILVMTHLMKGYAPDSIATLQAYQLGFMSLCLESAKGIDGHLHSSADSLIQCLLDTAIPMCEQKEIWSSVEGIIIALIHETYSVGFHPIQQVVIEAVRHLSTSKESHQILFAFRLLKVILGTRKGTRISDWGTVMQAFSSLAEASARLVEAESRIRQESIAVSAEIVQFSPMDQLLPFSQKILDFATDHLSPRDFFSFCTICADLDAERFTDLVLPRLQQYISAHWSDGEVSTYYLLERFRRDGIPSSGRGITFDFHEHLTGLLSLKASEGASLPVEEFAGRVHLPNNVRFPRHQKQVATLLDTYHHQIVSALQETGSDPDLRRRVLLGWGLETYLDNISDETKDLPSLVLDTSPVHFRMASFLSASNSLFQQVAATNDASKKNLVNVRYVLVQNLLSTSMLLKKESLRLLSLIAPAESKDWFSETTELMLDILDTPYTPGEARKIAMLLRRLPQRQTKLEAESAFENLVPFFCLGLLSHYHDQTRKEVCNVLSEMVKTTSVEESVVNIAIQWLQTPTSIAHAPSKALDKAKTTVSTFECSNLSHIDTLCENTLDDFKHSNERLLKLIEDDHIMENTRTPENGRTLGLQVLSTISASAERRSRLLVPIFLSAPMTRGQVQQKPNSDVSTSSHTLIPEVDDHEWSLSDRKALLSLFSKFINPRVLFKSGEVYEKMFDLLSNGNAEVRKLALEAIFTWKEPAVTRYEATLFQVAEDKATTTELGTLLSADEDQSSIGRTDRPSVFPLLLRLVFGLIVGRAGTTGSQEARRKSVIRTLFRMDENEIAIFLDIALGRLKDIKLVESQQEYPGLDQVGLPEDQQYGFLRLLLSMLETMQSRFAPYGEQVVNATVFCIIRASRQSHALVSSTSASSALSRNIRRVGFQCLVLLFQHCPSVEWSQYLPTLFANAISPRLDIFASETNHGISGLLRLFASWVESPDLIRYLLEYDKRVPQVLWQSLMTESVPKEVKVFVLEEIVLPWTALAEDKSLTSNHSRDLLQAESQGLLSALLSLLERTPPKEILHAITIVLPRLASLVNSPESRRATIRLLTSLLRDSSRRIPPNVKSQLLLAIYSFLDVGEALEEDNTQSELFDLVSSLFDYFKDQPNRHVLCQTLESLSSSVQSLAPAARICYDLNAVSSQRLEEFDYDRRLRAFQAINSLDVDETSEKTWRPIVYNLLFFVRTVEDLSIRSNALSCLKQFIIKSCGSNSGQYNELVMTTVLPSVKRCIRAESESVRADFVSIYGLLVQHIRDDAGLQNLKPLLVGNDEEASFFSNILHIQQHRRLRAIRRLMTEVEKGLISAQNNAELFIPLLEMFVYDSGSDDSVEGAKSQSIAAMGVLLQWIDWRLFKVLFHKYKNAVASTDSSQKATSRLLGHAADAILAARNDQTQTSKQDSDSPTSHLANSLPDHQTVERELRNQFIPKLADLVHYKDETEISFRIPVAVTTIKLITMLPQEEVQLLAAPILLDIAQILRSRTQESRDVARRTLCQIVTLLGPSSLQFVLKEMRTALTRGYQLHVVSYTLHAILVSITPTTPLGDLDYCVEDLVSVIMDDIFGAVGQEKESQDYISSMKEVKSSKSYDSMELLARTISVSALSKLVDPIQILLVGALTTKHVRQIDELLRRMGAGVSQNPGASKRDVLVFSFQLIQALYQQKKNNKTQRPTLDEKNRQRYLVRLVGANKAKTGQSSPLLYKIARFALDLVRSTFQKHGDVLTAENVHGFLPVIGDALMEAQEDVKISSLRLLSAIIKLPMPELDQNAPLYVMEAVKIVKNSTSTNEEAAQAALKFVAAVLRERKSVKVRDLDIADLLHRITPDMEEPDRQGVTFNFIRAVMARKIQIPEIYELADKIGIMMVTNQTKGARDVARGVFVHFLLEYPQSSTRWSKQQKFFLKNLEYEHPEGRQSVLEAINTLIGKMKGEPAQELASTFFVPVLLRMVNDDNKGCRELAGALLGQIFLAADRSTLNGILEPLHSWIEQTENEEIQKISMQAYTTLLGSGTVLDRGEVSYVRDSIAQILQRPVSDEGAGWELLFQALLLLSNLVDTHPDVVLNQKQTPLWSGVWSSLNYPNAWVRSTAASLVCGFFRNCVSADLSKLPLSCSQGVYLDAQGFLDVLKASVRILRRGDGNEDLSDQAVQILLFLGQCMDVNGLVMKVADKAEMDDEGVLENDEPHKTKEIPALQYLFDQVTHIVRTETTWLTTAALLPKKSSLTLLSNLVPALRKANLTRPRVQDVLLPLQHLVDPNTIPPRSADPAFASTYQTLIELAHEVMEKVQSQLGDTDYVQALTDVTRIMRTRREERRTKRRVDRVVEPEKAAREKRRKSERKKERQREIGRTHQQRRREIG